MKLLGIWLPEGAKEELARRAAARGLSLSEYCRHVLLVEVYDETAAGGATSPAGTQTFESVPGQGEDPR
jgi:hypothetical protein